ncbi:MAG: hypothetical protein WDO15_26400 [Bacteroidota bacterium]
MRLVYILTIVVVFLSCKSKPTTDDIPTATLESVGIDSAIIHKMTAAIHNHEYSNVHSPSYCATREVGVRRILHR